MNKLKKKKNKSCVNFNLYKIKQKKRYYSKRINKIFKIKIREFWKIKMRKRKNYRFMPSSSLRISKMYQKINKKTKIYSKMIKLLVKKNKKIYKII